MIMRKLFVFLFFSLLALQLKAQTNPVEIDGVFYNFISKGGVNEAEVSKAPDVKDVVIPEKINYDGVEYVVTSLGKLSFSNLQKVHSVTLPKTIRKIKEYAFLFNFINFYSAVYISDIESWMNIEFENSDSNPLQLAHHLYLNGEEVKDVVIPEGYTSIGKYIFEGLELNSVTIPKTLTYIGNSAFGTTKNVYISDLEAWCRIKIENSYSNPLFNVGEGGGHLFCNGEEIITLKIPEKIKNINDYSFSYCRGITSLIIPNGVNSIGNSSFLTCSGLNTISIPNTVKTIGKSAFELCSSLKNIEIPNSITDIESSTFADCIELVTITIPNNVNRIGSGSFSRCGKLTSIIIGSGVNTIEKGAFSYCKELTDVYCHMDKIPSCEDDIFKESYVEYATLHVPEGCVDAYRTVEPWKNFKEIVPLADTKYTLAYMVDGEEYKSYQIAEGSAITPEPAPTKEGYEFSGWSTIPATMPAEDVTITGTFTLLTDEDEITIKEIGKTTWCSKYDLDFTNVAGIKAYIAMGYDDIDKTIWLGRVMKVPAGTGVLVKGDAGTYKIPHASVRAAYANWFVGNLGDAIKIAETDGDKTNYYLSGKDGTFVSVNGSANIGKNKAYLQLPTSVFGGTRSIGISYDDEDGTTSIKDLAPALSEGEGAWYTLQGQRVAKPGKGLYIRNGKKVVVR